MSTCVQSRCIRLTNSIVWNRTFCVNEYRHLCIKHLQNYATCYVLRHHLVKWQQHCFMFEVSISENEIVLICHLLVLFGLFIYLFLFFNLVALKGWKNTLYHGKIVWAKNLEHIVSWYNLVFIYIFFFHVPPMPLRFISS